MFICICILFPVFNRVCLVITRDDDLSVFPIKTLKEKLFQYLVIKLNRKKENHLVSHRLVAWLIHKIHRISFSLWFINTPTAQQAINPWILRAVRQISFLWLWSGISVSQTIFINHIQALLSLYFYIFPYSALYVNASCLFLFFYSFTKLFVFQ